MSKILYTPIVGSFARQGGKTVLMHLGVGTALVLAPEPENQYDPEAIRIEVELGPAWADAPASLLDSLDAELAMSGLTREELAGADAPRFHLGYVPRSGGKPLAKAQSIEGELGFPLVGNHEIGELIRWATAPGELLLSHSGSVVVKVAEGRPE